MRRRTQSAADAAGPVPADLRSMRGVAAFLDPREPVPVWVPAGEAGQWRSWSAWRRWSNARREWAAQHGVDYVATFYPHWLRRAGETP